MFARKNFYIDDAYFYVKKDRYPLSKIKDVRSQKVSLISNLMEFCFWLFIFSGMLWPVVNELAPFYVWILPLAIILSIMGCVFGCLRCSFYRLQIRF